MLLKTKAQPCVAAVILEPGSSCCLMLQCRFSFTMGLEVMCISSTA